MRKPQPKSTLADQLERLATQGAAAGREAILAEIMAYAGTDLLCYRAPNKEASTHATGSVIPAKAGIHASIMSARPGMDSRLRGNDALRSRQDSLYDPILAALEKTYGIAMRTTDTLSPIAQPLESLDTIRALIEQANPRELAALFALTPMLGSALLALALWKRHITVDAAIAASQLDETIQAEHWGEDAAEKSARETKAADIRECVIFLDR